MKNVVRNNFWMVIIAWCFVLRGMTALGIVTLLLTNIYLLVSLNKVDYLKMLAIALCCLTFDYFFINLTFQAYTKYIKLFVLLLAVNEVVCVEVFKMIRLRRLHNVFIITFGVYLLFNFVIVSLNCLNLFDFNMVNALVLITVIFVPYIFFEVVEILDKEYRKKELLKRL